MEIKKRTGIRSMQYEEFANNDYLERMVRRLNADGAGVIVGTADELINWQFAMVAHVRNKLLRHRVHGAGSGTL